MKYSLLVLILSILLIAASYPQAVIYPDDARNRIGWAFDAHNIVGEYPGDTISRYDLYQLYGTCPDGWYYDFGTDPRGGNDTHLDYKIHMLWGATNKQTIESIIAANPDDVIIVGNEPELVSQNDLKVHQLVDLYYNSYRIVKSIDANYAVGFGGISSVNSYNLTYLQSVMDLYKAKYNTQLPVDVWTVHLYKEIPASKESIIQQVSEFRKFMSKEYQNIPLWVTEFNITSENIEPVYDWLLTSKSEYGQPSDEMRNVQRFAHFALNRYGDWQHYTFERDGETMTEYGKRFYDYYQRFPCHKSFFPFIGN